MNLNGYNQHFSQTKPLFCIFFFQLWYAHRPPDDRHIRNRAYSSSEAADTMAPETMKLNVGISSNGDVDVGEVSLADMDPEDIRVRNHCRLPH